MRVHVLGRVTVLGPDGSFDERDLPGSQAALLLAVLVVERRQIARDALADLLWSGCPPTAWPSGLNALVSRLRTLFDHAGVGRGALASSGGTLELTVPTTAWIDVESAERHLDRAWGLFRHDRVRDALAEATAASAVLRRPLLPGIDNPWCDDVRRRLTAELCSAYELLAQGWHLEGDFGLAAAIAERAIEVDSLAETPYRLAISAHLAMGDRGRAVRLFERCRQLLETELGVEPSDLTASLIATNRPVPT
jgi:DNA-binding SARP family transcriptional activator